MPKLDCAKCSGFGFLDLGQNSPCPSCNRTVVFEGPPPERPIIPQTNASVAGLLPAIKHMLTRQDRLALIAAGLAAHGRQEPQSIVRDALAILREIERVSNE